ncbi:MAG: RHS repeat-associated core domain-containing protein [Gallionella sp.]
MERLSYDAWGKRRNANGTDDLSNALVSSSTDHGYTGHEHLDDMGLIHMNGRVYDPRTGRFLQADPTIQSPGNLQSFNRYSYVMNNPFFYTDPSGYFSLRGLFETVASGGLSHLGGAWKDVTGTSWSQSRDQYIKPAVVIVASIYLGPMVYNALAPALMGSLATATQSLAFGAYAGGAIAGAISGAAVGAVAGGIMGGNLQSAIQGAKAGAISGGVFGGLGAFSTVGNWGRAANMASRSMASGLITRSQGGDFAVGTRSMFLSQAAAWGYEATMGYAADPNPGTNDPNNSTYPLKTIPPQKQNTIGYNGLTGPNESIGNWDQGGSGSQALNTIPGFNALSKPHDVLTDIFTSGFSNVATMLPAAAWTYTALLPAPLIVELSVKQNH